MPTTQNNPNASSQGGNNQSMSSNATANAQQVANPGRALHINVQTVLSIFGIIGGIFSAIMAIYTFITDVIVPISNHTEKISTINNEIASLNGKMDGIDDDLTKLTEFIYLNVGNMQKSDESSNAVAIRIEGAFLPERALVNGENVLKDPKVPEEDTKFATGLIDSNIQYTPKDLQNRFFITVYNENGNEIYFKGKYNEKYRWDGECFLNVYKGNELISVFTGIYIDGNLYSYRRISCDDNEWTVTHRKNEIDENGKEYRSGETWKYSKTSMISQAISQKNVDDDLILNVDDVLNRIDKQLTSYYNGNTSDGKYNDNTGSAYMASYDNGNLRYLYRGKVKNGTGESENGWAVILVNDEYRIYEGSFSNGSPENYDRYEKVTEEKIQEIRYFDYKCPLTGLID